jgi:hypothetical protein
MPADHDSLPARVFLRPIGSPLTIGLSGLAVASLVASGLALRWISVTPVLPTFRRGRGRLALRVDPRQRVGEVSDEAGVRQTT